MNLKVIKVRVTFQEGLLGTSPSNPDTLIDYVAPKDLPAEVLSEEVDALASAEDERGMTVFPRDDNDTPFLYDYQVKGFFKDTCSALRRVSGTASSGMKAHKKCIDGTIFVFPRQIPLIFEGDIKHCIRPMRGQTAQGERIALSNSEEAPAGTVIDFEIHCLVDGDEKVVREWLDYGIYRGIGQWRNSGKGRFTWEEIDTDTGEITHGGSSEDAPAAGRKKGKSV